MRADMSRCAGGGVRVTSHASTPAALTVFLSLPLIFRRVVPPVPKDVACNQGSDFAHRKHAVYTIGVQIWIELQYRGSTYYDTDVSYRCTEYRSTGGPLFIVYCDTGFIPKGTTAVPSKTQESTRNITMPRNAIVGN